MYLLRNDFYGTNPPYGQSDFKVNPGPTVLSDPVAGIGLVDVNFFVEHDLGRPS